MGGKRRRVEPQHAWGVVFVGLGMFAGVPAIEAVVRGPGDPLHWWFVPGLALSAVLVIFGFVLLFVPVMRTERRTLADVDVLKLGIAGVVMLSTGKSTAEEHADAVKRWNAEFDEELDGVVPWPTRLRLSVGRPQGIANRRMRWLMHKSGIEPEAAKTAWQPPVVKPKHAALLPWLENDQLILAFTTDGNSPRHQSRYWVVECEVEFQGRTWLCPQTPDRHPGWQSRAEYPRDFRGAPPVQPGAYEVRWYSGLFTTGYPHKRTGRTLQASRRFTVYPDGSVWI